MDLAILTKTIAIYWLRFKIVNNVSTSKEFPRSKGFKKNETYINWAKNTGAEKLKVFFHVNNMKNRKNRLILFSNGSLTTTMFRSHASIPW